MRHEMSIMVGPMGVDRMKEFVPEGTVITSGDTKLMWNQDSEVEVEAARETFNKLTKRGYRAFKAEGKDGHQGALITAFDPAIERMILIPQMKGGARG